MYSNFWKRFERYQTFTGAEITIDNKIAAALAMFMYQTDQGHKGAKLEVPGAGLTLTVLADIRTPESKGDKVYGGARVVVMKGADGNLYVFFRGPSLGFCCGLISCDHRCF